MASFLDMNYDCLREVYKYLSLADAFTTIGMFNETIDDVARDRISEIKEFFVNMRFPPDYPDELLKLIGKSIKTLFVTVGYSIETCKALDILRPLCNAAAGRALTELRIQYIFFDEDCLDCILPVGPQIEVLSLCNCQLSNDILKYIVEHFVKLRHLDICSNYDLSPQTIDVARTKIPVVIF